MHAVVEDDLPQLLPAHNLNAEVIFILLLLPRGVCSDSILQSQPSEILAINVCWDPILSADQQCKMA